MSKASKMSNGSGAFFGKKNEKKSEPFDTCDALDAPVQTDGEPSQSLSTATGRRPSLGGSFRDGGAYTRA